MKYELKISDKAKKQLKKIDKIYSEKILKWINKNLKDTDNPYLYGKPLKGNLSEYWRYRVGIYRILAKIDDKVIKIFILEIDHRKEIYD